MNDTPTPRTDASEIISMHPSNLLGWPNGRKTGLVPKDKMQQLETELTAAREEIKELNDKLDDAVSDATNAVNDIIRMKWQRDRLAKALEEMRYAHTDKAERMAIEALAAVKGGTQ